jgi:hypothetical protein
MTLVPNIRFFAEQPAVTTPSGMIQLVQGRWNGSIVFHESAPAVFLRASDREGHIANGNRFAVESSMDIDADGLPDSWEQRYFGSLGVGPGEDSDGDGLSNEEEFLAGTAPNEPTSAPRILEMAVRGSERMLRFATVSGKSYRVEKTETLDPPQWGTLYEGLVADGPTLDIWDAGAAGHSGFYRIRVDSHQTPR